MSHFYLDASICIILLSCMYFLVRRKYVYIRCLYSTYQLMSNLVYKRVHII